MKQMKIEKTASVNQFAGHDAQGKIVITSRRYLN